MISPEIAAEQIMGYVVWASELIPTLKPSPKKPYSVAIVPQWPHFYTWLLQAAGYLLLDNKKKKMLVISQQSDDEKHIVIDITSYGPVFGKIWKNSINKTTKIVREIGAKKWEIENKSLSEQIHAQLPFLRIITQSKEIVHMSIGKKTWESVLNKTSIWIKEHIHEYNIVFLTNIELPQANKSKKVDEHNKIAKIIQSVSSELPLLSLFQKILHVQKKKLEIIAYVNPGDFGKPTSLTTRYVCAVG